MSEETNGFLLVIYKYRKVSETMPDTAREQPGTYSEPARKPYRKVPETTQKLPRNYPETAQKILELIQKDPYITRKELVRIIGNITEDGIKYHLRKFQKEGIIRRIGPAKGGHWEVVE